MAIRVMVPGHGIVEFPDGTSEQDMRTAIATLSQGRQRTWTDTAVDALPAVGGAIGGLAGMGGGPVGAVAAAGAGGLVGSRVKQYVNALRGTQPLPSQADALKQMGTDALEQGGAQAIGAGAGAAMRAAGPALMRTALKPTTAMLSEYRTNPGALVKTLLDEGVNVTEGGIAKLQQLLGATNDEIAARVASAPGTISKNAVAARVLPTANRVAQQVNPSADLNAVGDTVQEFLNHPVAPGPTLTVPEAQAMKVGTYQRIGKKYGEVASASLEAQKSLARGLKEEVARAVPGLDALNQRDSSLMGALDAVGRRVAVAGNRDPVGFAWVAQHPTTFLAALVDRNPAIKSMLARGMYQSAATVAGVSPNLIRGAMAIVASGAPDAEPQPAKSEK